MQAISQSSAHAIRVLTFLAQQPAGEFQLVRRLADALELPAPYLAKILQPLTNRGLLESQRGRGGGFRLARAPAELSLRQIVDALERLGGPRECLLGQAECGDDRACPLHDFWKRATDGFHARLAATHLSDMVDFCRRAPESGYPFFSADGRDGEGRPTPGNGSASSRARGHARGSAPGTTPGAARGERVGTAGGGQRAGRRSAGKPNGSGARTRSGTRTQSGENRRSALRGQPPERPEPGGRRR